MNVNRSKVVEIYGVRSDNHNFVIRKHANGTISFTEFRALEKYDHQLDSCRLRWQTVTHETRN